MAVIEPGRRFVEVTEFFEEFGSIRFQGTQKDATEKKHQLQRLTRPSRDVKGDILTGAGSSQLNSRRDLWQF
jgi:hypothetical protein